MSDEPHPAQELAELVADLSQAVDAWRGVGLRLVSWEQPGPGWPEHPPEQAPRPEPAGPPPVAAGGVEPPPALQRPQAPSLFPQQQPRPRAMPPRRPAGDGPSRWSGYGTATDPGRAMAAVRDDLGDCTRCGLHRGRAQLVFGVGDPTADLVVVGEAPGFHEDQQGEPFVGPAGQMLDRMLVNVLKLQREQVYIMNVLKCRPPDNRDPEPDEVTACRPFFDAQLNVIRPRLILSLGRYASQSLLGTTQGIKALRGRWGEYRSIPVMPTFHPAYLLRQPQDKRLTFQDLLTLKERLERG